MEQYPMAGPFSTSTTSSQSCAHRSSNFKFIAGLCLRVSLLLLVLELHLATLPTVNAHVIRSPNESNHTALTTPLTNLTPQEPDLNSFDISVALYSPAVNYISLPSLPTSCAMYNTVDSECSTTMIAVNASFDDCTDAWTVCHCSSANMSLDDAVERLGMVPVGLRRFIATTLVLPGEETHAYSLTNGDLHMFGDCQMETWIHEATHSYDYVSGEPISGSQAWLDALNADSCATDNYGKTNAVEEFAQMSVLKIFSLIYDDMLPSGWNATCMSNQLTFLSSLPLFDKSTLFGNTCAIPPPPSPSLPNSNSNDMATISTITATTSTSTSAATAAAAVTVTPSVKVETNNNQLNIEVSRPIKLNGPVYDPDAPLRVDPCADPTRYQPPNAMVINPSSNSTSSSASAGGDGAGGPAIPMSAAQDPSNDDDDDNEGEDDRKSNNAVSSFSSRGHWEKVLWQGLWFIVVFLAL